MKELLGFFMNQVFVGVFQYDCGTPKRAVELTKVKFVLILPKRTEFLWYRTQGPRGKIQNF